MKFLIDMNLSPRWRLFFHDAGFEAVHWRDIGNPSASDKEIFDYARSHSFTLFTHDLDFSVLLANSRETGPSVVQLRTRSTFPETIADAVISGIRKHYKFLSEGAIVTIDIINSRVKTLPIK